MTARSSILVAGIGSVLMGDDGLGPYVLACFEAAFHVPPDVELLDAGTPGLDLVTHLSGRRAALIIDAVRADAPPGTVRVYARDEILAKAAGLRAGQHEPALRDAILALQLSGEAPEEVVLVGVVPGEVRTITHLSGVVRSAVPSAVDEVVRQLTKLGVRVEPRSVCAAPDVWWDRTASPPSP